jgi:lipid-A-disaccharide synthase
MNSGSSLQPPASSLASPLIILVAGEASGDTLGHHLIHALKERLPTARFAGVAGPKMIAAGCTAWEHAESLAVMGLFEVLQHLPRLLRLRRGLVARLLADPPALFIGIDAPEFNLGLAAKLHAAGIPTIQYVSPQVWAWRQGRVRKIAASVDRVLCLLPFEKQFYDSHAVKAVFVGHPLADEIPLELDRHAARAVLGMTGEGPCIAILPGSRDGEVSRLGVDFARTIAWVAKQRPDMQFVAPMVNARMKALFAGFLRGAGIEGKVALLDGQAHTAMAASDAVLLASGTATLEATLSKRPMVVAYRLGFLTSLILKVPGIVTSPFFAQPNLLANRRIVPEFFNDEVTAERLGPALLEQIDRPDRADVVATFTGIHQSLRRDASRRAADAVVELLEETERRPAG